MYVILHSSLMTLNCEHDINIEENGNTIHTEFYNQAVCGCCSKGDVLSLKCEKDTQLFGGSGSKNKVYKFFLLYTS